MIRQNIITKAISLCLIVAVPAGGCAMMDVPVTTEPSADWEIGRVGVVAKNSELDPRAQQFLEEGKPAVASGAAAGAEAGVQLTARGMAAAGPLGIVLLPAVPIFAIIGAIVGGTNEELKKEETEKSTTIIGSVFDEFVGGNTPTEAFAAELLVHANNTPGYVFGRLDQDSVADAAAAGFSSIMHVNARWTLEPNNDWLSQSARLVAKVQAELVRTGGTAESIKRDWTIGTGYRTLGEWAANDGKALREVLESYQAQLVLISFGSLFESYIPGIDSTASRPYGPARAGGSVDDTAVPMAGFLPIEPHYKVSKDAAVGVSSSRNTRELYKVHLPRVPSSTPTLVWEPLPGRVQLDASGPATPFVDIPPERIEDPTYDLKIRCFVKSKDIVVNGEYSREGLAEPRHTVEEALPPDSTCVWAVRAHFIADGRQRVTIWTRTYVGPGNRWVNKSPLINTDRWAFPLIMGKPSNITVLFAQPFAFETPKP